MMRTACIRLKVTPQQAARLSALRRAYADACNRLVPLVQAARCWNRVALHQLGYRRLRQETSLGAQLACNAIFSVCKAYRIRDRLRAGRRMRTRLHRWAFRQLQSFVEYKARAVGISVEYVNPAYSSQTCSACGQLGTRLKHRFECSCGLRAHADLNASRNLARIGETAVSPRAVVNTPDVGRVACHALP
jgi:IS605 OrfB family transposase